MNEDHKTCWLCGLKYAVRYSADISECFACHRLLNRLFLMPIEQAVEIWDKYKQVVDAIRLPEESQPPNWNRNLGGWVRSN